MSTNYALLGLPDLAQLLRAEGIPVLSEDTVVDTARAVRDDLNGSASDIGAAIILDTADEFLAPWISSAATHLDRIVVLHGMPHSVTNAGAHHFDLPIDAHQILDAAGAPAPAASTGWSIATDGSVTVARSQSSPELPPSDDWGLPGADSQPPAATLHDSMTSEEDYPPGGDETPDSSPEPSAPSVPDGATGQSPRPEPSGSAGPLAARRRARQSAPQASLPETDPGEPDRDETDVDDLFGISSHGTILRPSHGGCPVVFSIAMKGGVGKTTSAIGLAERAASRGLKVTLIDMNRGQADIMTVLRLARNGRPLLPTVYEATTGDPSVAITEPAQINDVRFKALPPITYRVALGPPRELADPAIITETVYRSVLEEARRDSDLVVVDTQILEATDTSTLFDRIVFPYLAAGQWALVVTSMSSTALSNTKPAVRRMLEYGASAARTLTFLNEAPDASDGQSKELSLMPSFFGSFSTYLGAVERDPTLQPNMNAGITNKFPTQMDAIFDDTLFRISGLEQEIHLEDVTRKKTGGLLAKLFGGTR